MTRTLRTVVLSATTLAAVATAAAAAPSVTPPSAGAPAGMHSMMAGPVHEPMLDDPAMQTHMAEHGTDIDQMHQDAGDGRSHHHATPGR